MKKIWISIYVILCLLGVLTGCTEENPQLPGTTTAVTETAADTLPPESVPAETTPAGPVLLERPEGGKVCVGFLPTEAGNWRYAVIEDQEAALAAYEKATGSIYSDEWWIKGDRTNGLMVVYGEIWNFVESGELVYALGRVKAEDASDLYALCEETAREAGWKAPVMPEQLTGIASATLRISGQEIRLTDAAALAQLEDMLSAGKYELGGTGCPFTALLDVTLESGEILSVALATDSCSVWMSEGYYYNFEGDSVALYDLFGVTLEALW